MTTPRTSRYGASPALTLLASLALALSMASTAGAQAVSNPRIAEFDPSADHWTDLGGGGPAVLRYELGVYMVGASAPFTTLDMGKPSPEADGKIRYDFSSSVSGWPLPGGSYEARVAAVGPEGSALSEPSNPFTFGVAGSPCTFALGATSASIPVTGGRYAVDVQTGDGCSWSVSTTSSWIALTTLNGSGSATVPFDVLANSSTSSRAGSVRIGGQTLALQQAGLAAPTLTWTKPAAITQGTPLGAAQLNATASVPGTFAYNPAAGTVLTAGTRTLGVTFTPTDPTRYTTATASTTITVNAVSYTLTIARPANGTVMGSGINCGTGGSACSVTMPGPMTIGLQAVADTGYTFASWSGSCSGASPTYSLSLNGPASCGAAFAAIPAAPPAAPPAEPPPATPPPASPAPPSSGLPIGAPYTLTIHRQSGGVVRGAGINCGTTARACTTTMPGPMTLGVQATPDPGYRFVEWTGHCSGSNASYAIALEGARTCAASFVPAGSAVIAPPPATEPVPSPPPSPSPSAGPPYTLSITRPSGGTIRAAGINCGTGGSACSVTMPAPLWLGMLATPDRGYRFSGWTGDCSGAHAAYALSLAGTRTCGATFVASGN